MHVSVCLLPPFLPLTMCLPFNSSRLHISSQGLKLTKALLMHLPDIYHIHLNYTLHHVETRSQHIHVHVHVHMSTDSHNLCIYKSCIRGLYLKCLTYPSPCNYSTDLQKKWYSTVYRLDHLHLHVHKGEGTQCHSSVYLAECEKE